MEKILKTNASPTIAFEELLSEKRPVPKFYLSCGTEDGLYDANIRLREKLIKNGADVTWDEEKGGHDWDFWDSQIKKFIDWLPLDEAISGLGSGNVKIDKNAD